MKNEKMRCVTHRLRPVPIKEPKILYQSDGMIEFKNGIGTKVTLIKSQCSKIVTLTKNHYTCGLTLDDKDVKFIVDWLIEQGMIDPKDIDLKFKNVFEDSWKKDKQGE